MKILNNIDTNHIDYTNDTPNDVLHVGLDVGSTTVKIIVMNQNKDTIYKDYQRHFSDTKNTVCHVLEELLAKFPSNSFTLALTGSGAMSAAKFLGVNFIQEVVSCKRAVELYIPKTDVVIELGGEDAKIIYFDQSIEQRMNRYLCWSVQGLFWIKWLLYFIRILRV